MYRNIFLKAYAVHRENSYLVITRDSCFKISEATHALVAKLPAKGTEKDYLDRLGELGIKDSAAVFKKLVEIKCLTWTDGKARFRRVAKEVLNPVIELIPSRLQERLFFFLRAARFPPDSLFKFSIYASLFGLALAIAMPFWSGFLPYTSGFFGAYEGAAVMALVALSVLVHELGHSFFAYLNGIGFRPIGFSMYLFFPVFYANISGVSELELKQKLSVNLGGLALQGLFMGVMTAAYLLSGQGVLYTALLYISYLIIFNMNPIINTDTFWCYKDTISAYKGNRVAELIDKVYSLLSFIFTIYLFYISYKLVSGVAAFAVQTFIGNWTAGGLAGALLNTYVAVILVRGIISRVKVLLNPQEAPV